jgi:hypothetical protein
MSVEYLSSKETVVMKGRHPLCPSITNRVGPN